MLSPSPAETHSAPITESRPPEPASQQADRSRLDTMLQAAGMVGWEWDVERNVVHHLGAIESLTGASWTGPQRFFSFVHLDDQARVALSLQTAWASDVEHRQEFRICRPDGTIRWVSDVGRASVFPDGRRWLSGVLTDITERKAAQQHRTLLINELNHRVKNTLAVIQGVAAQTFRGRDEVAARLFQGRLHALSTAHNVLTHENWESAGFHEIVEDAIRPFSGRSGPGRVRVSGPDLRVPPKTAVALAMALHELGSNAVKYGALSAPQGAVDLDWSGDDDRLRLTWSERGGPTVSPPDQRGFGSRMIERGLAAELGGRVTIQFRPEGVLCTVDAPLPRLDAPESDIHA